MRRSLFATAAFALALAAGLAHAQRAEAPEASVKAAFLFKFAGYVEWDSSDFPSADAPFVIAVVGADEIAADLERIVPGRLILGRAVVIKRVKEGEALRAAHMVFIGRGEGTRLASLLRAAQSQGVLAVTESPRALELGSTINFIPADDRVGFEISLDSAEKSGHKISSRMLTVARRVIPRAS